MKTKVIRRLSDLKPAAPAEDRSERGREWTATIVKDGQTLYAWVAYNQAFDTFATATIGHARLFRSEAEVEQWIERLHVPNATPVRIRHGKVIGRRS